MLFLLCFVVSCFAQQALPTSDSRVAIVGAGAGGASCAYYLQKFTDYQFNITIFEKNSYVGGRATIIDFDGVEAELGASMFIEDNKILYNAVDELDLSFANSSSESTSFALWNGESMDYILEPSSNSLVTNLKLLWRFGLYSIAAVKYQQQAAMKTFLTEYYEKYYPLPSLNSVTDLLKYTSVTAKDLFDSIWVSANYQNFVQSLTRNNYAQNLGTIHSLGSLVLLSGESSFHVAGGNNQIFEKWVQASGADLRLNTPVTSISKTSSGYAVSYGSHTEDYDVVVLAGPYDQLDIKTNISVSLVNVQYVHLHVTLVRTPHLLSESSYFNNKKTPQTVLTTGGDKFNSIGFVGYSDTYQEYVYKVFSYQSLDEQLLQGLFGKYSNKYEKTWYSYPYLSPISKFDEFKLADNLYYLNGMEQLISTMETSSLAGATVAGLLAQGRNTTQITVP
ncbi:hypothetical protein KL930_000622 [Ogataea haglerorum]|uniref:Prenylcysteine lyase domain-containing protein n=1 Tax=Ogataea haglerorum TaxID=1937702 RepID=A0AAN6DBB5_9ASCO|nr:uncharacterized protein KL911_005285 [Ogataea haglerorum]KAG7699935.1 hypothetical protein KL915_000624 [Ogataea haglerorum]KAG7701593.1 hypothetical protein KL951_000049 [Ogataea haglerorum]KAG7711407.1 hypothetical protein KL914_000049 [Ogataea haglerorum]KAG7722229.1 hypothetical protein KL913_000049 [Ogataea haglerorum]KAG7723668.1 hypothetical protein KL949_000718 [Ogataea haglerorum]